jgi:Outer membrane protein beta-barrel domain/SPOR domain
MTVNRGNIILTFFAFSLLLSLSVSSFGQTYTEGTKRFFDNWRINLNMGANLFHGDIEEYSFAPYKEDWRMAYGLMARKQFTPVFGMGLQLLKGRLHGTKLHDGNGNPADLAFDANMFEYNMHAYFDLSTLFSGNNPNRPFTIYGLAGMGFSNWESKAKTYSTGAVIKSSGTANDKTTEWVIPVGMGLRYNINNRWGLNFESTLRGVNSDKLDAWIGGFKYDVYNYSMLGLTYNFNSMNFGTGDPAAREARNQRRQSRLYERQLNKYDNQVKYVKTKPSKSYEKELKRYEYEQKYDQIQKQTPQPSYQEQTVQDVSEFQNRHFRGDLPVVTEYDAVGIFEREQSQNIRPVLEQPMEVEVLEIGAATTFTSPIQTQNNTTPQRGRLLTDYSNLPNEYTAEIIDYGSSTSSKKPSKGQIVKTASTANLKGVTFGVQILAKGDSRADVNTLARKFQIDQKIMEDSSNGLYRYIAGAFNNFDDANRYAKTLRQKGIYDAFVVAYQNGRKISLSKVLNP